MKLKAIGSGPYDGQFRNSGEVFDFNPFAGKPKWAEEVEDDGAPLAPRQSEFRKMAEASAEAQNAEPGRRRPRAPKAPGADLVG